jgi:Tol biopolymer transport system component
LVAASSSCGGDAGSVTAPPRNAAYFLTPRALEDTAEAVAAAPLTIEVRDSVGMPAVARRVILGSHDDVDATHDAGLAQFSLATTWSGVTSMAEVTDARGQLTVNARLSDRAGSGWIILDAGALGRDSIHVVVRAGAPTRFTLGPRDTVLLRGASYTLSATVFDRHANVIAGVSPSLVVRRAKVGIVAAGLTVNTASPGATFVVGTLGPATDSATLKVVPSGTLVAFSYEASAVATFDLDGSNYRRTPLQGFSADTHAPHWLPQTNSLVFHSPASTGTGVGLFTMGAANQPTVLYTPATEADGMYPQPSRDGAWIYYAQRVGFQSAEIWRMRADGSGRERVGPAAGYYDSNSQPTPSPDGTALVYIQNNGGVNTGMQLSRLDLATGVSSALPAFGTHPRWSPVAPEIAYLAPGAVRIVQANGTGDRLLATYFYGFDDGDGQLDWSPDGKWLVACTTYQYVGDRRLALIERATGEVIPLPYTYADKLCEAAWIR